MRGPLKRWCLVVPAAAVLAVGGGRTPGHAQGSPQAAAGAPDSARTEPGLLFYVMVDDVAATLERISALGGAVVQPVGADAPEVTARFRDPGGNVVGLYQEPRGTSAGG